jgi:3'-phosphoadenosine 5'-phosphosulfate sulfotransferase (PAPS reductase)/FAD synthetase
MSTNRLKDVDTILVSFSGGRTSGFMGRLLQVSPIYKDYKKVFIYANTGKEHEETLQFIKDCDDNFGFNTVWVEADITQERGVGPKCKVVDFETATRIDQYGPFDALVQKLGIPNPAKSGHCTRDIKNTPINKFMTGVLGYKKKEYITAIGIRGDEPKRLTDRDDAFYPLADPFNIDELAVRQWWKQQTFDLQLPDYKGNCNLCFKKSERKMLTCMAEEPEQADWWIEQEESAKLIPGKDGVPKKHRFSRAGTPAKELLERAIAGDFDPIKDKFHGRDVLAEELAYDPAIFKPARRRGIPASRLKQQGQ